MHLDNMLPRRRDATPGILTITSVREWNAHGDIVGAGGGALCGDGRHATDGRADADGRTE